MPQLPPIAKLKPLIARIHKEFANQKGWVPWTRVFKKHPEWEKALGYRQNKQRIYTAINSMRMRGELSARTVEAPGTGFAPITLHSSARTEPESAAPADQVLEKLIREYYQDGMVNFAAAWAEHPEWRTALGAETPEGMRTLYWRARKVSERLGLVPPKPKRPYKPKLKAPPQSNGEAAPTYTDGLPHCPHCGGEIAAWNRAYNASKNQP